jgi:lysozyme family protein
MTNRFLKFIKIVKKLENGSTINGYVNDPLDTGGETVSGVSRKNYPSIKIWQSLDKLDVAAKKRYIPTEEELNEIDQVFYKNYYLPLKIEDFTDEQLALQVFDTGVNAGVSRSAKILQEVVKVTQDGIIGINTLTATNLNKQALELFKERRKKFYNNLVISKPSNQRFINGWLNRVDNCKV